MIEWIHPVPLGWGIDWKKAPDSADAMLAQLAECGMLAKSDRRTLTKKIASHFAGETASGRLRGTETRRP